MLAAEFRVRAARDERLPEISFDASYGGGGVESRELQPGRRSPAVLSLFHSSQAADPLGQTRCGGDLVQRRAA